MVSFTPSQPLKTTVQRNQVAARRCGSTSCSPGAQTASGRRSHARVDETGHPSGRYVDESVEQPALGAPNRSVVGLPAPTGAGPADRGGGRDHPRGGDESDAPGMVRVRRFGRPLHQRSLDGGGYRKAERPGQGERAVHVVHRDHARGEIAGRAFDALAAQGLCRAGRGDDADLGSAREAGPKPRPGSRRCPSRPAAAARIPSSRSIRALRSSRAAGISAPVTPKSAAATKTNGLAASIMETATVPAPPASRTSTGLPVGSREPVTAPPGSRNSRSTGAPVPETPGISVSPLDRRGAVAHRKAGTDELSGVGVVDDDDALRSGRVDHALRPPRTVRWRTTCFRSCCSSRPAGGPPRPDRTCSPRPRRGARPARRCTPWRATRCRPPCRRAAGRRGPGCRARQGTGARGPLRRREGGGGRTRPRCWCRRG